MHNVFEYLIRLGHDEDFQPRVDHRFEPTDAPMGSKEKIEVLARRAQLGLPLWHPHDRSACSLPDEICQRFLMELSRPVVRKAEPAKRSGKSSNRKNFSRRRASK